MTRSFLAGAFVLGVGLASASLGAQSMDWPQHDLNVSKNRYAALDEINTSNAQRLALAWSFDGSTGGEALARITPIVVNGVMYVPARSKIFALHATTGKVLWSAPIGEPNESRDGPPLFFGQRGPTYGDGRLYLTGPNGVVFAFDSKNGKPAQAFGDNGTLPIVAKALAFKYPGKYASTDTPTTLGYQLVHPPVYHNGVLYLGVAAGDNHIEGGLVIAADGATGAIRWVFNTIPQGPADDGWAHAEPTWRGGGPRVGGGIWTPPAIDPELGFLYVTVGNPSPAYDGSTRHGVNLFTNSLLALHLATGRLAWHFQALHHDIWDLDTTNGPVLFDGVSGGKQVKGVAFAGKTCYLYALDRKTGAPINPIVETPVPTNTDFSAEQVWPTQPIPYTSRGIPQQPACATLARVTDPALAKLVRPMFEPFSTKGFIITSPGVEGGPNWGASAFSPKTGLIYVAAKNSAQSSQVKAIGDTAVRGPTSQPFWASRGKLGPTGMDVTLGLAAYDPLTGHQAWYIELPTNVAHRGGNLVTGGDLVFQGSVAGTFHALDARSGRQLWMWQAPGAAKGTGVNADPLTFQVNGKQYVSVAATNHTIYTFALP